MSRCLRFILSFLILSGNVAVAQEQRMVRVGIYDVTEVQRISSRAEIWFKGCGSVWLNSACYRLRNGSLSCSTIDLGMRQIDQTSELFLYVNGRKIDTMGRETNEIKINIKMTSSMCKPGCDRDMIIITNIWRQSRGRWVPS